MSLMSLASLLSFVHKILCAFVPLRLCVELSPALAFLCILSLFFVVNYRFRFALLQLVFVFEPVADAADGLDPLKVGS